MLSVARHVFDAPESLPGNFAGEIKELLADVYPELLPHPKHAQMNVSVYTSILTALWWQLFLAASPYPHFRP